jgi:uncharacterized protein YndB with AHSA1/START domain
MSIQEEASYELTMTRTFDAPRDLVWRAWTEPEMAKQWMGPRGFRATEFTTTRTPGQPRHLSMEGNVPGTEKLRCLKQGGNTIEVRPPELLKYTFAWGDRSHVGLDESLYSENIVTVRFEEAPGNRTIVHFHQAPFATEGERDGHSGGWNSALHKFAEFLAAEQPERVEDADVPITEYHLRRTVAAPRDLVFKAWTDPAHIPAWWGPKGFSATVHTYDARSGGAIRIDMIHPDGSVFPVQGSFDRVYPPHGIQFRLFGRVPGAASVHSVWLEETNGFTEIILDMHIEGQAVMPADFLKGMRDGWIQMIAKLGQFVEAENAQNGEAQCR